MTKQLSMVLLAVGLCGGATAQTAAAPPAASPAPSSSLSGPFQLAVDLGSVPGVKGELYLLYYNTVTKKQFMDSLRVDGPGVVVFKGELKEPILAHLSLEPRSPTPAASKALGDASQNILFVYLQPGDIRVKAEGTMENSVVRGSPAHADYLLLKWSLDPYITQLRAVYKQFRPLRDAGDTAGLRRLQHQADSLNALAKEKVYKKYVLKHASNSPVAVYALAEYAGVFIQPDEVEPLLGKLAPAYRALPTAMELEAQVAIARSLEIGAVAPDFTETDTLGAQVSLSSFRGRYVLIDFWASWCGPCRRENPDLVDAYHTYKNKNFTILGVSLDRPGDRDKWLRAIHEDHLAWTQVSDLRFWDNAAARAYGVQSIPQNLLIDPQGKIIAKNLKGDELEQKLARLPD